MLDTLSSLIPVVMLFGAVAAAPAAELAVWEARLPAQSRGLTLQKSPDSVWRIETTANGAVVRLKPADNWFTRAPYVFAIADGVATSPVVWLSVEFLDQGYGLIGISPSVHERDQWGIARVNSGQVRKAVFRYDRAALSNTVRVEGLDYLRAVRLLSEQPVIEPVPLVKPAIDFKSNTQRVTTAAGEELSPDHVKDAPAHLRNRLPLVRALGFNGVESYVKWGLIEREPGVFDWSFYDSVVDELERHGVKWFPMLVVGSGYALPKWFFDSKDNVRFKCLEHGLEDDTQSIFYPAQAKYAQRFLIEFGKHYGNRKGLLGIRLGPSGDYGEAQYPAKGPGFGFRSAHNHIGYWAGDEYAPRSLQTFLRGVYPDVSRLNKAWESQYGSFDEVKPFLPYLTENRRKRVDFGTWYMDEMSKWCEKWAIWSREALPNAVIHQSSGGWGPVEIGTDYSYQAKSMSKVKGGMRLTNESDNFPDNFTITRMASSAARYYGAALGYEPGGYASKRGVMARLFNAFTTNAEHLFYYLFNLTDNDYAVEAWIKYGNLMDQRSRPVIEVATLYPDASIKLNDELVRYRWGSNYFQMARALRVETDYDYAGEQMVLDGALDKYKVLVFLWGPYTEKAVLERIDAWVRKGGTVIMPRQHRGYMQTVEGDGSITGRWIGGQTGKGKVIVYHGDAIPAEFYAEFVADELRKMPDLHPGIKDALRMTRTPGVYWSVLESGKIAMLNFSNHPGTIRLAGAKAGAPVTIPPYEIALR
ncbi:MAG: beta-galactosidase [Bryobacterales bacterium]|nr:beta-galactosidase [Bryobacterales bacterium]